MRGLSIKGRVTLWYTLFMAVLTAIVLFLLVLAGNQQILASVRSRLERAVSDNLKEIEYDKEDGLEIDDDLRTFQDGVYLLLYDEQGNPVYGRLPYDLKASQMPAFQNGKIQEAKLQSVKWVFFDVYKPLQDGQGVWMRGMISQSEAESGLHILLRLFMLFAPLFVAAVAVGGYVIIYRAFAPIEKMRRMADEITDGNDLSRRIRLGSGTDEIYQLADTFDRMLDRIQRAYEREKQFTADASHELRTPVSVISSQAEYALRHGDTVEGLRERMQVILTQSRKISGLLSQLLLLARADQGREKLQKERIHLSELVEIIAEEERERAAARGIQIHTDCQPALYVEGDETMLMRCFINLIENAVAYGKDGGNIWIGLAGENDFVQGYVRDDGIGIREEHLPNIWERFYQADPARSSRAEGSAGLGLSLVKWIVEAHGGSIRAESRYQQGTTFYFSFSCAGASEGKKKV